MTAYAIRHLGGVRIGPVIIADLRAIAATLEPHGGRFLVHGADREIVEGDWPGDLVIVAFPAMADARACLQIGRASCRERVCSTV